MYLCRKTEKVQISNLCQGDVVVRELERVQPGWSA